MTSNSCCSSSGSPEPTDPTAAVPTPCSCGKAEEQPGTGIGSFDAAWVARSLSHAGTEFPVVSTVLTAADRLGAWKLRWGIGRYSSTVQPGLYAVGNPDENAPVFVTANYKLSFDRLRVNLAGYDGWVLVLDTKGINVWCAAGKGTFGTRELVTRIALCGLDRVVAHRTLILPQLGATGIAGHLVKQFTGFRVVWGPVRAEDLPAFLERGLKATPDMRLVRFPLGDRLALVPLELVMGLKYALPIGLAMFAVSGFGIGGFSLERMLARGIPNLSLLLAVYAAGAALTPILLPWLPGRAFALKGGFAGALLAAAVAGLAFASPAVFPNRVQLAAWMVLIPAVVSFLGMQFTGASTYTSLSGVMKEMKIAIPLQIAGVCIALVLWVVSLFVG